MNHRIITEKPRRKGAARDDYLRLVRQFPLRPIRTATEYDTAAQRLDTLVLRADLSDGEKDYVEALSTVIEEFMNNAGIGFWAVAKRLFTTIAQLNRHKITSQVFIGSLLLYQHGYERAEAHADGWTEKFSPERFKVVFDRWANPPASLFCTF